MQLVVNRFCTIHSCTKTQLVPLLVCTVQLVCYVQHCMLLCRHMALGREGHFGRHENEAYGKPNVCIYIVCVDQETPLGLVKFASVKRLTIQRLHFGVPPGPPAAATTERWQANKTGTSMSKTPRSRCAQCFHARCCTDSARGTSQLTKQAAAGHTALQLAHAPYQAYTWSAQ